MVKDVMGAQNIGKAFNKNIWIFSRLVGEGLVNFQCKVP